ncbi:hypothetical protein BaRGS_00021355 [Batillaria attramentaria]|uniref:Uncharacterized protein n=1 Tax=Batillaria attramentaria TaxID=370345 RepID=A0ABD0KJV0_9CAEN
MANDTDKGVTRGLSLSRGRYSLTKKVDSTDCNSTDNCHKNRWFDQERPSVISSHVFIQCVHVTDNLAVSDMKHGVDWQTRDCPVTQSEGCEGEFGVLTNYLLLLSLRTEM